MVHVVMPQFGETVAEGELTRWLVAVGDTVAVDQPVAEISTDKVDTEVLSSHAGTVTALLAEVGATIDVGQPLLELDGSGSQSAPAAGAGGGASATPAAPAATAPAPTAPAPTASAPSAAPARTTGDRRRSTPKARRLARERGIDITTLAVSGAVVRAADVLAASGAVPVVVQSGGAPAPTAAPASAAAAVVDTPGAGEYLVQHSRVRRITAARTHASLAVSATAWSVTTVDYANVDRSRKSLTAAWKARQGVSLTYLPYVMRAVVLALGEYPHLNSRYTDDGLIVSESVHLGVAVDLGASGLAVPVVRDADRLGVAALATEMQKVSGAARSGSLSADAYAGSTFTITNNGSYGSVLTMPIINQPNVAILSLDAIRPEPTAVPMDDGTYAISVHPRGSLAMSWDHRAIDGAYAASFLTHVRNVLETTQWQVSLD